MARVTPVTAASAARAAGFTGRDLTIAVAIAGAESGYKRDAVSPANSNGSRDYGLWQINSVHIPTAHQWSDVGVNAQLAYRVYADAGKSFRPWTTYKSGAYLLFVPTATAATAAMGGAAVVGDAAGAAGDAVSTAADAAGATVGALAQVGDLVAALGRQETWLRAAKVVGGLALVGIGVSIVARPMIAPATRAVTKVASKGAV